MKSVTSLIKTTSAKWRIRFIPLVLAIITVAVYWQVHDFSFVTFDDPLYVTENEHVQQGLSRDNLIWAFNLNKSDDQVYWHPLTWLSHMLDCQIFGVDPGTHHIVNLMFHTANVLLLFLVLHLMTGAPWKSAFAAALFALHPINVDSVAWISERKNLLSTFFWMLTLLAYIRYSRRPDIFRYLTVLGAMALGLLAKPMLVTLPFVFLLLDFWPLGRMELGQQRTRPAKHPDPDPVFQNAGITRLVMEKIPLLALSIGFIAMSVVSLQINNQMVDGSASPMNLRIENAFVSYIVYLWKLIWPARLAVFYPFPKSIPLWQFIGAFFFIAAVSVLVFSKTKKKPWRTVGWFWYLGTLMPVIGLVQGGLWPALADRWAYVPFIGIFIIIAWEVPVLLSLAAGYVYIPVRFARHIDKPAYRMVNQGRITATDRVNFYKLSNCIPLKRLRQTLLWTTTAVILCCFAAATHIQLGYWKNSQTLFEHAIKVTAENDVAHNNLGLELYQKGLTDEANYHYLQAIAINPHNALAHNNLGNSLGSQGKKIEAIHHYQQAIKIRPNLAKAHFNLANTLRDVDRNDQAIMEYRQAVALQPNYEKAFNNLGNLLLDQGRTDEAVTCYQQALAINPNYSQAQYNLSNALKKTGRLEEVINSYLQILQHDIHDADAHYNLANAFKNQGHLNKAIHHYRKAIDAQPDHEKAHQNLATVLMCQGRLDEAIMEYSNVLRINPNHATAQYNLGIAYFNIGNTPAAVERFKEALRLNPDAEYIRTALNQVLERESNNK